MSKFEVHGYVVDPTAQPSGAAQHPSMTPISSKCSGVSKFEVHGYVVDPTAQPLGAVQHPSITPTSFFVRWGE